MPAGGEATAPTAAGPRGMAQHPLLSLPRSELEPQGQDSAMTGEPAAEADDRGSSAGDEELEQLGLT